MQILIVEDEQVVAMALARALESRGHEVAIACDGRVALGLARPDVLIADPEMSGLSGLDLLEEYRRCGQAPRTIFLSADPSLESCRRALRLGAQEFLSKPFRLEELVRAVEASAPPARPTFARDYPATRPNMETCLRDVAAFALQRGIGPTCRARCCTALGEIIVNVIEHAYPFDQGEFQITATLEEREFVVTLRDHGIGFDVVRSLGEHLLNGGGLTRAAALSEALDVNGGLGAGITVTLRFCSYLVDFAGEDSVDLSDLDFLEPETTREVLNTLQMAESAGFLQLPPALAVVIGRLLAGPDSRRVVARAFRS